MRVWFFIDGFNFYHSVQEALKDRPQKRLMWLNLKKLCEQHLHVIGRQATLAGVDYFTAIPLHLVSNPNADADAREKAISDRGRFVGPTVMLQLGRFGQGSLGCF